MKKQNRYGTIAALTLGLCLVATYAFAADYTLINSSGGTIEHKCTEDSSYTNMANGVTRSITCSGNLQVRAAGATQTYSTSEQCYGGPLEVTV